MEGILVMISTNTKKISSVIIFFSLFFVYSCETINEITGITKPDIDDTLISETPELILPPDFNREPKRRLGNSQEIDRQPLANQFQQPVYPTVVPRITNYYSPEDEASIHWQDSDLNISWPNDFEIILIHSRLGTSPFLLVGDEQKVDALLDQTLIKSLPHYRVGCCNDTSLFHEFHH